MSLEIFEKPNRRRVRELNLVPIIDMLTTVIFFLLLSTSFMEFTKITVPPSKVSTITDPVVPPPLAPKMMFAKHGRGYRLVLSWAGAKGGEVGEPYLPPEQGIDSPEGGKKLFDQAQKMVKKFIEDQLKDAKDREKEKSLQMGFSRDIPYQSVISLMDGVRETMPDVVLISYDEAEARVRGTAPPEDAMPDALPHMSPSPAAAPVPAPAAQPAAQPAGKGHK